MKTTEKLREAEEAAEELRKALALAGITLPSLRLDPVSCAREEPTPLVDLGCCVPETARHLAEALTRIAR